MPRLHNPVRDSGLHPEPTQTPRGETCRIFGPPPPASESLESAAGATSARRRSVTRARPDRARGGGPIPGCRPRRGRQTPAATSAGKRPWTVGLGRTAHSSTRPPAPGGLGAHALASRSTPAQHPRAPRPRTAPVRPRPARRRRGARARLPTAAPFTVAHPACARGRPPAPRGRPHPRARRRTARNSSMRPDRIPAPGRAAGVERKHAALGRLSRLRGPAGSAPTVAGRPGKHTAATGPDARGGGRNTSYGGGSRGWQARLVLHSSPPVKISEDARSLDSQLPKPKEANLLGAGRERRSPCADPLLLRGLRGPEQEARGSESARAEPTTDGSPLARLLFELLVGP